MERIKYLDFDLLIEKVQDRYRARVLQSPAGQASAEFVLPFTDQDIEILMLRVGRTRRGVRRIESPEMQAAKQFGGKLFDAVFANEVRGALRSSVDAANRENAGLRVRLRLADAPELLDLPWEYLYNASLNRFLALSNKSPLVRYIELPETPRPLKIAPPLRVLVMISSPSDYEQLDVNREWQKLNDALRDASASNMVTLERIETATLGALRRKLRQGKFHVLHFIGHGGFDAQTQDGVLLLEDEQGRGRRTSGQYLAQVLTDHDSLRLVVLNACEGARTARTDPFAGVAQSLVQQGIPAVIAMQFEITDQASITFAHEFYSAVADGYPVDAALSDARSAIFSEVNDLEWGTPVLYLRASDGMIFTPLSEQERAEHEQRVSEQKASEQRAREREQLLETLYIAAQINFAGNDFDAAEKSLATLLAQDATNANALELQTKIQDARARQVAEQAAEQERLAQEQRAVEQAERERQEQIETLNVAAQNSFEKNDFDAVEKSVAALLALDATHAQALELQTKLPEARERQEQIELLVRSAQIQLEQDRLDAADKSIDRILELDSKSAEAASLQTQLAAARKKTEDERLERERQQQIADLSRSADEGFAKKDFDSAERSVAALLMLDATNAHALELQKQIQAARAQMTRGQRERERKQKIAALLALAQSDFTNKDFDAADKALATLFALDASNADARKLQAKIQEARKRVAPKPAAPKPAPPAQQNLAPTSIPERAQPNVGMPIPASTLPRSQGFPTRYALPIAVVIILALVVCGALALGVFKLPGSTPLPTRTLPASTAAIAQSTSVTAQNNTNASPDNLKTNPVATSDVQQTLVAAAQKTFAAGQSNTRVVEQTNTAIIQKTFVAGQSNTRVVAQTKTAILQRTLAAAQANAHTAATSAARQSRTAEAKKAIATRVPLAPSQATLVACAHPSQNIPSGWRMITCDTFDSIGKNWSLGNYESATYTGFDQIRDGKYIGEFTPKESFLEAQPLRNVEVKDFYLTVTGKQTSATPRDTSYGLRFRESDFNYYLFQITDSKNFMVYLRSDGKWTPLIDWQQASAILPEQTNRLTVLAQGAHFTFFINDEKVGEIENNQLTEGRVGMAFQFFEVGEKASFEFDGFELWTP